MSDIWLLRIGIVVAGLLLMAAIYFFGRPRKPNQGRKLRDEPMERPAPRSEFRMPVDAGAALPGHDDVVFAKDDMSL